MKIERGPEKEVAQSQWQTLFDTFQRLGVQPEIIAQGEHVPDMVFTANAGLVYGKKVVMSNFRFPERQAEEPLFESWFLKHGFEVARLQSGAFEGEGDALFVGKTLIGGYGFRTDRAIYEELPKLLGIDRVFALELINPHYYHLDTCFCPLFDNTALCFPGAFSKDSLNLLGNEVELLAIPEADADRFACNSVIIGNDIIMPAGCPTTAAMVESRGFTVHPVVLDEFLKAGGAAKCLCLKI